MNLGIIVLEIALAFILFIIMNFLKKKKVSRYDTIILPNIFMIIAAAIIPWFKDYTLPMLIFYLAFDVLYLIVVSKRQILEDEKEYYKTLIITLILGIIIYNFYLLKVENAFLDMEIFKNFIWVLIILYFLKKINIEEIKPKEKVEEDYNKRYQEYVVVCYAKFKNKYAYLIKTKETDIENLLYSFLIYENYLHGNIYRIFNNLKNNIIKGDSKYGLMGVKTDHYITNEEAIVIMKEQLEGKLKRIKKTDNKEENLKKLINEKYKVSKDIKEIFKIMNIIEEFNKNN